MHPNHHPTDPSDQTDGSDQSDQSDRPGVRRAPFSVDFAQAPLLVIWEVTRACALACRHCRASAIDWRDPRELSLDEGKALLDEIKTMGTPIVVLTGGDPIQRDDLEDLIAHGKSLGLRMGTIPAGTPRLTRERLASLKAAGIDQVAFSLDAPTATQHDDFRRVPGSFDLTLQGARWARELGIPLQINTVLCRNNIGQFDEIAALVSSLDIVFWEVFFLVPTGRGSELQGCNAEETEALFAKLHALSKTAPYVIKVTEAQHYRRHLLQHKKETPHSPGVSLSNPAPETRHSSLETRHSPHSSLDTRNSSLAIAPIPASQKVVNAGNGFCFVDHTGDICPSGFLATVRGNVRTHSITQVYRQDELFRDLRNPRKLKGKCGRCEYRAVCGGSRSRANSVYGDPFAEEPTCILER
ncbi:MAG: TIGR04053 family radical SAM/SPASM domain-containing protein [Verrucomicrobia bacterium]|nr:TIGR04053 family radical SAM/SPASM domain-containing protein [Verrucomicrobiota bacterium]MCH8513513.1 TIGR04053 family radical SAM/SPASM domain-containing protein [Kiritimatiellia bacterium]